MKTDVCYIEMGLKTGKKYCESWKCGRRKSQKMQKRKHKHAEKYKKNLKIWFFTKTYGFTILVEIGEVLGCPGGGHGPYEDIVSNFGRVWSYMASESTLFNI
jgi:hypothetical protein